MTQCFKAIIALLILSTAFTSGATELLYDAEDGSPLGWTINSGDIVGVLIENTFDEKKRSRVFQFYGDGRKNSYLLGSKNKNGGLNITENYLVSWSMNFSESYELVFWIDTAQGRRQLKYSDAPSDGRLDDREIISYSLGESTIEGQWITTQRNLYADLQQHEPENELLAVHGLVVRGSGSIDDLAFEEIPDYPPATRFTQSILENENAVLMTFDARGTTDDRGVASYQWNFGDGSDQLITTSPQIEHLYTESGRVEIRLTATDDAGQSASFTRLLTIAIVPATDVSERSSVQTDDPARPITVTELEPSSANKLLILEHDSVHDDHDVVIDGKINESAWENASSASNFRMTVDRILPTDSTEVLVLADLDYLYFAFKNFDNNPEKITARKTLRDGGLADDDRVSVQLDTYNNYQTASTYSVNAQGTQQDVLSGGRASKIEWKGDWKAAASLTDYGWSAEFAIPFDILNFDSQSTRFGINFYRYQNRTKETSSWVLASGKHNKIPIGQLEGFSLPTVKKDRVWTIMPYVVGGLNTENIDGEAKDRSIHGGITIRYEPRHNITGLIEMYPDFSQIESQILDIDFSYTEKEASDPRPFFQEGSAYFDENTKYFYSRRIPDFRTGLKSFMQNGENTLSGLFTVSPDSRQDLYVRYRRNLTDYSEAGFTAVATEQRGFKNQLFAVSLNSHFESGIFYEIDSSVSRTVNNEIESANSFDAAIGWAPDHWEIGLKTNRYDTKYLPSNGLLANDLPGTKGISVYTSYYQEVVVTGLISDFQSNLSVNHRDTLDGQKQTSGVYADTTIEILENIRLLLSYNAYDYRPLADEPGIFQETINNDRYWATNIDFNVYNELFGYGFYIADGRLGGGDYQYLYGYAWLNPTQKTNLKLSTEKLDSFGSTTQTTLSGGIDISHQDGILARYSKSKDFEAWRIAYRRTVRSGTDIFSVYENKTGGKDEFSIKLIWTF